MSDAFTKKYLDLSMEFDTYVFEHIDLLDKIPNGAYIVVTVKGDDKFNAQSISMVRNPKRKKVIEAHKVDRRWSIRPLRLQTA